MPARIIIAVVDAVQDNVRRFLHRITPLGIARRDAQEDLFAGEGVYAAFGLYPNKAGDL